MDFKSTFFINYFLIKILLKMKNKKLGGMKMENKYVIGIVALSVIVVLGLSLVVAFPFGKNFINDLSDEEKSQMQEQRQAMQNAIENQDYEAWKTLMQNRISEMQGQITEENFNKLTERREQKAELREAIKEAKETGDWSQVQELKDELSKTKRFINKPNLCIFIS